VSAPAVLNDCYGAGSQSLKGPSPLLREGSGNVTNLVREVAKILEAKQRRTYVDRCRAPGREKQCEMDRRRAHVSTLTGERLK